MSGDQAVLVKEERADLFAWLAVAAGALGALMASLDIAIINSALPAIQGEIGASGSDGTWIGTSFLIAEIISIILSGWLERLLGLRRLLLIASTMFTAFSMLCGMANSLDMMILGRIGQGLFGGVLIPTAMAIVSTRLPPSQRAIGFALFSITVMLGPVLGPLVGGLLAEHMSWRYSFFINLPVGIVLVILILTGLAPTKARYDMLRSADWVGIFGLAIGLGALTFVLEDGQREMWFESPLIRLLSLVAALGFAMVAYGQLRAKTPAVALYLLRRGQFLNSILLSVLSGIGLFGTLYLTPQFLGLIAGYNSAEVGYIVLLNGVPFLLLSPLFPLLMRTVDIRILITSGVMCLIASSFLAAGLTPDSAGSFFIMPQLLMSMGMFLTMAFLSQVVVMSVEDKIVDDASAIFNCARNLGGSVGLALIATMMDRRQSLHLARLSESITQSAAQGQTLLMHDGGGQVPMALMSQAFARQAAVMAFSDIYLILGGLMVLALPLALMVKPIKHHGPLVMH